MNIEDIPLTHIDWDSIVAIESRGESGTALSKVVQLRNTHLRMVEFSRNYHADYWCAKGHIVHVLEGVLVTLLEDGKAVQTIAGNSFLVGEGRMLTAYEQ
jgi:hypothetical protein